MAEIAGLSASIITILDLSIRVTRYIRDAREAGTDRDRLIREIGACAELLKRMKDMEALTRLNSPENPWLASLGTICMSKGGPLQTYKMALDTLKAKPRPAPDVSRVRAVLKWPFDKEEIRMLLDTIERQKTNMTLAVHSEVAENLLLSNRIQSNLDTSQRNTEEMLRTSRQDSVGKIREWMSTFPCMEKHEATSNNRMEHSGTWFLNSVKYQNWREPSSKPDILWCSGIPGAGKTVIS
ncbi:MAG: hypothetical protein M1814_000579 [Vezdaea aestivalis]|nr:MAG: hypothetical protein M1814_000579 [Vezdaea aestivalis]